MRAKLPVSARLLGMLLVAAGLGMTFQAAPTLVVYYKFDEAAGPTAADSSPNMFNGTWSNTTYVQASAVGDCAPNTVGNQRSIIFTMPPAATTDGGYINIPNNPAFTFTGAFSATVWIKPSAYNAGYNPNDTGAIIQKWDWLPAPGVLRGWAVNRNQNGTIYFHTGTATAQDFLTTSATTAVGAWTHVACVYTGTNKYIYLNGVLSTSSATTLSPDASPADLHIGKDDWARNFYGNVDEVKLYGGALSAADVLSIYNGVNPPTNLTATAGYNQITLNWTAVTGATGYNIFRSGTSGGPAADPYVKIGTVNSGTTTTYIDSTNVTYPNTYYYVVQTVVNTLTSTYSNEVSGTPLQPPITVNPGALTVAENGGTAMFTVNLVSNPTTPVVVTATSGNPADLTLNGGASATLTFNPGTQSLPVTVTAINVHQEGAPVVVPITFTTTVFPPAAAPPPLNCTINQDLPAIIVNPTSGLATTNGGPSVTFTVSLATVPQGSASLALSVSDPNLATVSPTTIPMSGTAAWNSPVTVTVTPLVVNTQTTYMAPYDIIINPSGSADAAYAALPDALVPISTPVSLPPLAKVWGCGATGAEGLLPLLLLSLWRRRRRA
jgi:uncharacterized protein (TIGR03382 family)